MSFFSSVFLFSLCPSFLPLVSFLLSYLLFFIYLRHFFLVTFHPPYPASLLLQLSPLIQFLLSFDFDYLFVLLLLSACFSSFFLSSKHISRSFLVLFLLYTATYSTYRNFLLHQPFFFCCSTLTLLLLPYSS